MRWFFSTKDPHRTRDSLGGWQLTNTIAVFHEPFQSSNVALRGDRFGFGDLVASSDVYGVRDAVHVHGVQILSHGVSDLIVQSLPEVTGDGSSHGEDLAASLPGLGEGSDVNVTEARVSGEDEMRRIGFAWIGRVLNSMDELTFQAVRRQGPPRRETPLCGIEEHREASVVPRVAVDQEPTATLNRVEEDSHEIVQFGRQTRGPVQAHEKRLIVDALAGIDVFE